MDDKRTEINLPIYWEDLTPAAQGRLHTQLMKEVAPSQNLENVTDAEFEGVSMMADEITEKFDACWEHDISEYILDEQMVTARERREIHEDHIRGDDFNYYPEEEL